MGGQVSLHYCMTCGDDLPVCGKIMDCWWEYIDIAAYLKQNLSAGMFERLIHSRTKPKLTSLMEHINRAIENSKDQT